jgi:hypothetical protein
MACFIESWQISILRHQSEVAKYDIKLHYIIGSSYITNNCNHIYQIFLYVQKTFHEAFVVKKE